MNRKLKIGFIVSLLANVVLIGALIGQWPRRLDRDGLREQRLEQALSGLPAPEQAKLREKFQQLRASAEPLFVQLRQAEAGAIDQLVEDVFDEATYDRQVSQLADMRRDMVQKLGRIVKDSTQGMSAEERRQFAALLRRPQR